MVEVSALSTLGPLSMPTSSELLTYTVRAPPESAPLPVVIRTQKGRYKSHSDTLYGSPCAEHAVTGTLTTWGRECPSTYGRVYPCTKPAD